MNASSSCDRWLRRAVVMPLVAALTAVVVAQQARSDAPVAPQRGFGMGPPVSPEQVGRAVAATPPIPAGPFEPTWESIERNYRVPEWFRDGKFGIFLHWGLYSVPGYHNEWYQKYMYGKADIRS